MSNTTPNQSFINIAGILSILSALGYLGTMMTNFGIGDRMAYGWLGLFGTVLLVPSICGFYLLFRSDSKQHLLMMGTILMLVGAVFVAGIYLAAMITSAISAYDSLSEPALKEVFEAFIQVINMVTIIIGSFLTYGISPLLLGLSARSSSLMPKWVAWIAIVGGVAGFAWLGFGWLLPLSFLIFFPSAILITIWQLAIGFYMFRWETA
jgi:hypothetical protein